MGGITSTSWKKGQVTNPKGRPPKTDAMRLAEKMLGELSPEAVKKLGELLNCGELKVEATVALGICKMTIRPDAMATVTEEQPSPHEQLEIGELKALARAQLAKEREERLATEAEA